MKILKNTSKDVIAEIALTIIGLCCGYAFEEFSSQSLKQGTIFAILLALFLTGLFRLPIIPKIKDISESQSKSLLRMERELENLVSDHKVSIITTHINNLNTLTQEIGTDIFNSYLKRFNLEDKGFSIRGEQFAIESYVLFWERLCEEQRNRAREGKLNMIARITHSNQIDIWNANTNNEAYSSTTASLYNVQREFIDHGGIIVRVLIGKEKTPTEKYKNAIKKMKSYNIEAKYLHEGSFAVQDYDFLYLHDEKLVLKWYADASGKKLSRFIIQDKVEEEVFRDWKKIFYTLKEQNNPIENIPEDREFY